MKTMKAAFGISVLAVVTLLASGCGSGPATPSSQGGRGNPPEIAAWIQQHQDEDIHYATGISEFENESDAMQQALALARENLAASLETEVAAISENAVRRAEAQGQTDRIARFQDATKQLVATTLRNVRTFGPYVNGRGNTYIIVYLDKRNFQKDVNDIVEEAFAEANSQLNNMLGIE